MKLGYFLILALAGVLNGQSMPVAGDDVQQPRSYVYREVDGQKLNAYVFLPQGEVSLKPTAAMLLFHGGGWVAGSADWTFEAARRFASQGLLAVAVDYRLSEGKTTPIEALDDARAAFRCELHVYPGVGHLLTRNLADQEDNFDPDPNFRADGKKQLERFLKERGYLPEK